MRPQRHVTERRTRLRPRSPPVLMAGGWYSEAPLRSVFGHDAAMGPAKEQCAALAGVRLCYETFGDESRPALLLVMGLGTQMIGWHADFCSQLAARGFFVVRYDNRDVGRSAHLDHRPPPTTVEILPRRHRNPAYT